MEALFFCRDSGEEDKGIHGDGRIGWGGFDLATTYTVPAKGVTSQPYARTKYGWWWYPIARPRTSGTSGQFNVSTVWHCISYHIVWILSA